MSWLLAPLALLAGAGALGWRIHRFGRRAPRLPDRPTVAVVLGARVFADGTPSDALKDRVQVGVRLLESGHASALLFSGGSPDARPTEALVAHRLALAAGAPPAQCLTETKSRSTFENAREVAAVLRRRGEREVIVITCDFHLLRAAAHFSAHRLNVFPVASPRKLGVGQRLLVTAKEVAALARRPWLL
ncbi:MAG: YdcF family protein [Myxococcales bacterium]|nr:YdcF family protein [Myxococcales bacterium]